MEKKKKYNRESDPFSMADNRKVMADINQLVKGAFHQANRNGMLYKNIIVDGQSLIGKKAIEERFNIDPNTWHNFRLKLLTLILNYLNARNIVLKISLKTWQEYMKPQKQRKKRNLKQSDAKEFEIDK